MKATRLAARLKESRFVRAVFLLASATAIGQALALVAMPLLTRLYSPFEFGVLAVFNAFAATALVASSLRYEFAIPLPRNDRNARVILIISLAINVAMAALVLAIVLVAHEPIGRLIHMPEVGSVLLLLPVVVLCGGTYKALNYWAVRKADFRTLARTRVDQSASNIAIQVLGGLAGWSVHGLVFGTLFGYASGTFRLARSVGFAAPVAIGRPIRMRAWALARRYHRFPKFDVAASLINVISVQLPNILLAALFSPTAAGLYLLADRVLSAPLSLAAQAIGQVLYSGGREGSTDGSLARLIPRIVIGLGIVAVAPSLVLFLVGDDLFAFVFGETWREAGLFASWLILGLSVQCIYSSISPVLLATEGQSLNLAIHLVILVSKVAAIGYGYYVGNPLTAVIGFALVNLIGNLGAIMVVFAHMRSHTG